MQPFWSADAWQGFRGRCKQLEQTTRVTKAFLRSHRYRFPIWSSPAALQPYPRYSISMPDDPAPCFIGIVLRPDSQPSHFPTQNISDYVCICYPMAKRAGKIRRCRVYGCGMSTLWPDLNPGPEPLRKKKFFYVAARSEVWLLVLYRCRIGRHRR